MWGKEKFKRFTGWYSVPHGMARIQIQICIIQSYWVFELCRITVTIVQSTITRVIIDWKHMNFPMLLVLNVKPTKTRIILKESLDGELFISGWSMGCMWRKILSMDVGRQHPLLVILFPRKEVLDCGKEYKGCWKWASQDAFIMSLPWFKDVMFFTWVPTFICPKWRIVTWDVKPNKCFFSPFCWFWLRYYIRNETRIRPKPVFSYWAYHQPLNF